MMEKPLIPSPLHNPPYSWKNKRNGKREKGVAGLETKNQDTIVTITNELSITFR
jgi:hypothetical protein